VAIALGSNLGDREAHLDFAVARLCSLLSRLRQSSRFETAPVDVIGEQGLFLNAAVVGHTTQTPHHVLAVLHQIERERGRERQFVNAPRTLDLDLILYDDVVLDDGVLAVPHPRFRQRRFVLEPLAEIAPDMVDPVTGSTLRTLFEQLP
jgi:2-amino-4-hydroxy-6-hydroxymethyldihydropteridine diphosphokinase